MRAEKGPTVTPHVCNNSLAWLHCVRRFWKWAENYTRGRRHFPGPKTDPERFGTPLDFYTAAGKFIDVDARSMNKRTGRPV